VHDKPAISVIFSTYNSVAWLEKVLWGFEQQSDPEFEIVIADDGSTSETRDFIEAYKANSKLSIKHVWHEDNGFQKCIILNKAICEASGDYLIFTDGDCIPRSDFVAVHRKNATPGYFLSGGYFKLPMNISKAITRGDVTSGNAFDMNWLVAQGYSKSAKKLKLSVRGWFAHLCDLMIPTKKTWNGHNSSGWKRDLLAVNGFDERMQYGGEDCEMGERLKNLGVQVKRVRYRAICVHLDHERGYVSEDMRQKNAEIRSITEAEKRTYTKFGLIK